MRHCAVGFFLVYEVFIFIFDTSFIYFNKRCLFIFFSSFLCSYISYYYLTEYYVTALSNKKLSINSLYFVQLRTYFLYTRSVLLCNNYPLSNAIKIFFFNNTVL